MQQIERTHIDDICLGDRFERNGVVFEVMSFPSECHVFCEASGAGRSWEQDSYMFRDEELRAQINNYFSAAIAAFKKIETVGFAETKKQHGALLYYGQHRKLFTQAEIDRANAQYETNKGHSPVSEAKRA